MSEIKPIGTKKLAWIKKGSIILVIIFGIIGIIIGLLSSGNIAMSTIKEFIFSPLTFVIILELIVIVLFTSSFMMKDQLKKRFRVLSLIILVSLISFYFYIPYMPIDVHPNYFDNYNNSNNPNDPNYTNSGWNEGSVIHILPAVNNERILLKTSFTRPLEKPNLIINASYTFPGVMTDTEGYYWKFEAFSLEPNTTYSLELKDKDGNALCDSWNLKTFPDPNSEPDHLRILSFTGSGGHDICRSWFGSGSIPLKIRQKILNKALSFNPDIVVGTGDQIYYDIDFGVTSKFRGDSRRAIQYSGRFNRDIPVLGTPNERVLKRAVAPQLSYLFGTACRSIPTFFILDDHDYFANDDAIEKDSLNLQLLLSWTDPFIKAGISFPPNNFHLELARAAQHLFMPEFLINDDMPSNLPGAGALDRSKNVSENYGSFRYGNLVESLLFDTRRYITLTGENATFIPEIAENWMLNRMEHANSTYFINFSPISFGWSAAKWLDWYPDVREVINGVPTLSKNHSKYMWQEGWFKQHNRILNASYNMKNSTPLFICGDVHSQSAGYILKSGNLDFSAAPIPSVLHGSLGVDGGGFPSSGLRGIKAQPPVDLKVDEKLPSYEKAGFIIQDITKDNITINFYAWKYGSDGIGSISSLTPHFTFVIKSRNF